LAEIEVAQKLLLSSYQRSAERILLALDEQLVIANSREPRAPPSANGDVVGLCGQGGRHGYFRLAEVDLRAAVIDIGGATCLEAVAEVCQGLRKRTGFDDGTGCVNDQMPAVVPLLPPEEIWYENREMPLDVWRLLSFDIDLVSSALSAHVPLDDIAFGSLTQAGLAFRAMMSRIQAANIEVSVSGQNLSAAFSTSLNSAGLSMSVPLARVFFEAGILLTPLRQSDISQWYAALRYMEWIANTSPRLCVRDEYRRESVDSRYRGLFAEEMAVGIMATVLGDVFGAKPIVNTVEVLAGLPGSIKKNVPIADFIAKARHPATGKEWTIISESKGSLGRFVSKGRIKRAKEQVASTKARFTTTGAKLPLAFCSAVFFAKQGKGATCTVIDPPNDAEEDDILVEPIVAWRAAYAKAFRFVGLDAAANQVVAGDAITSLHGMNEPTDFPRDVRGQGERRRRRAVRARERFNVDLLLDVGPCAIAIDPRVLGMLRQSGVRDGMVREFEHIADARSHDRWRSHSFLNYLGLGCLFYDEIDDV